LDEIEAGKAAFMELVADIAPDATAVIPTRATSDNFLIALNRAGRRVFITVSEDDLIDLAGEPDVIAEVRERIEEALGGA
jgi:hypothetical protein